jgi:lysophospholipase L1-like esterase
MPIFIVMFDTNQRIRRMAKDAAVTDTNPITNWSTADLAALADPQDALPFFAPSRVFAAQTVRQVVSLRRGGENVRLVFSNEFGSRPLVIDEIAVSDLEFCTVAPARLAGVARWEVPAGQTATSDPIPFPVLAGDQLVISCFVAGGTEQASYLAGAQRTGAAAPGNQLNLPAMVGGDPFRSRYWLTRVLVDTAVSGPVIVTVGDSITRGDGTSIDHDQSYPDHLQRRLHAAGMSDAVVINAGLGANRLLRPRVGPALVDRFDRDVLGTAEATHVVIMAGLNDIALPAVLGEQRPAPEEIVEGLLMVAGRAQRDGLAPILGTITPVGGARREPFGTNGNEDVRRSVNKALAAQRDWPVVDFAASLAEPGEPHALSPVYDSGDGLHPNDAGARALADAIDLNLFRD